jgi:hypothetical protein
MPMSNEYLNNKYLEGVIARFQKSKRDKLKYEMLIIALQKTPDKSAKHPITGIGTLTLDECLVEYNLIENEYQELQNLLAVAFFTLSDNLARYAKFSHIDIDDAVQEGVMICFEKIDRFNPEIGKAFNYMTTCILNHFRQLYRTARNYNELKKKYHDYLQSQVEQALLKRTQDVGKSRTARQRFGDMG